MDGAGSTMGTNFFKKPGGGMSGAGPRIGLSEPNMASRAFAAPGYAGVRAAGVAAKDLGAAAGFGKGAAGPVKKSAATDAPGPKV